MQLDDIINRLMETLPRRTTAFSTNDTVDSLSYNDINKEVTCVTTNENTLEVGSRVLIRDAKTPYVINTLFRKDNIAVAYTQGINQAVDRTVEITGANESDYNGTKTITDYPEYDIDNISVTGGVATLTSASHEIQFDSNLEILISGVRQDVYNRRVTVLSVTTNTLTFAFKFNIADAEASQGDTMKFQIVPNKYSIAFEVENTPTTPATGTIYALKTFQEGYNGLKTVTDIVNTSTFKYDLDADFETPAQGNIRISYDFRITGGASFERCLEHYKTESDDIWLYVTLDDETVSRNKTVQNDADVMGGNGNTLFQTVYQTINLYIAISTGDTEVDGESNTKNILAREARDFSLRLKSPLYKSLAGYRLPSELSEGDYQPVIPINNGTEEYKLGYYVHRYSFMAVGYLLDADYIDNVDVVRLQEIDLTMNDDLEINPTF